MSNLKHNNAQSPNAEWLAKTLERVLRPFVRLFIGCVSFSAFSDIAKRIFIEEAQKKLLRDDPKSRITKSSLALLTGIDTRAITQVLKSEETPIVYDATDFMPEFSVLGQWAQDPTYNDFETNRPMDLPIYGRGLTFQNLVTRTVGRNVTAQTVLDKLIKSGNIKYINQNTVRLESRFYFPLQDDKSELLRVGSDAVSNLMMTVNNNIEFSHDKSNRFVQQQRWTRSIPKEKHEEFRKVVSEFLKQQVSDSVDVIAQYEDPVETDEHIVAGVGYYYWEQE